MPDFRLKRSIGKRFSIIPAGSGRKSRREEGKMAVGPTGFVFGVIFKSGHLFSKTDRR
jgi:hypothetical protein